MMALLPTCISNECIVHWNRKRGKKTPRPPSLGRSLALSSVVGPKIDWILRNRGPWLNASSMTPGPTVWLALFLAMPNGAILSCRHHPLERIAELGDRQSLGRQMGSSGSTQSRKMRCDLPVSTTCYVKRTEATSAYHLHPWLKFMGWHMAS